MVRRFIVLAFVASLVLATIPLVRCDDKKECEVCVEVLSKIEKKLKESPKLTKVAAENAIEKICEKSKLNSHEVKLCYNLLPMKGDIAMQLTFKKPVLDICKKSAKKNADFCTIRFPLKTDANTDYSKLRVKELKRILQERGIKCIGCVEKNDFIKRIKDTEHTEL